MPVRVARMECQTVGVEWRTVTRPADSTNDQILLAASRSCACGHPVYDDQEPRCPLCACRDHRPRPSAARERSILFPAEGLRREGGPDHVAAERGEGPEAHGTDLTLHRDSWLKPEPRSTCMPFWALDLRLMLEVPAVGRLARSGLVYGHVE